MILLLLSSFFFCNAESTFSIPHNVKEKDTYNEDEDSSKFDGTTIITVQINFMNSHLQVNYVPLNFSISTGISHKHIKQVSL